jgi:hypothetical protein
MSDPFAGWALRLDDELSKRVSGWTAKSLDEQTPTATGAPATGKGEVSTSSEERTARNSEERTARNRRRPPRTRCGPDRRGLDAVTNEQ